MVSITVYGGTGEIGRNKIFEGIGYDLEMIVPKRGETYGF